MVAGFTVILYATWVGRHDGTTHRHYETQKTAVETNLQRKRTYYSRSHRKFDDNDRPVFGTGLRPSAWPQYVENFEADHFRFWLFLEVGKMHATRTAMPVSAESDSACDAGALSSPIASAVLKPVTRGSACDTWHAAVAVEGRRRQHSVTAVEGGRPSGKQVGSNGHKI